MFKYLIMKIIFIVEIFYFFFKFAFLKRKNIVKFKILSFFFFFLPNKICKLFSGFYLIFIIGIFNIFIYWPSILLLNLFFRLNFIIRLYFFIILYMILLYIYIHYQIDIMKDDHFKEDFEVFTNFFDPLITFEKNENYLDYINFLNSNFSFLRDIDLDVTFYKYYIGFEKEKNPNLFLHKAYFSNFLYTKYLTHLTQQVDWHYFQFHYSRGWINNNEMYDILKEWNILKIFLFFKNIFIFIVFKMTFSDVFLIHFKYYFLNNIILNGFFNEKIELFFFTFFSLILPDFFLLNLGFNYKYSLIICLDYFFDHVFSFFSKVIKVLNIGPGNYILKKKLMRLSTDFRYFNVKGLRWFFDLLGFHKLAAQHTYYKPHKTMTYQFLQQYIDDNYNNFRKTYLGFYDRTIFGNVIEMSPFIKEKYNIYTQTGYSNPRSYAFFVENTSERHIRAKDVLKPSYTLSEWFLWSKFQIYHDFFSKNMYTKYSLARRTYYPRKVNIVPLFFFGGDKSLLVKNLPKEVGWFYKSLYSFGKVDLSYIHSLNSIDNSLIYNKSKQPVNNITNKFLNFRSFNFYRNTDPTVKDIFPQYYSFNSKYTKTSALKNKTYHIKSLYKIFCLLETKIGTDIVVFGLANPYARMKATRTELSVFKTFFPYYFNLKGDFVFGNAFYNYTLFFGTPKLIYNNIEFTRKSYWFYEDRPRAYNHIIFNYPLTDHYNFSSMGHISQPEEVQPTRKKKKVVGRPLLGFLLAFGTETKKIRRVIPRTLELKDENIFKIYRKYIKALNLYEKKQNKIIAKASTESYDLQPIELPDKNIELQFVEAGVSFDFYDLWVNSLLDGTYISNEMGRMQLSMETNIPYLKYKRHLEYSYNLRFSSVLTFIIYFIKIFFNMHLIFFYFFIYFFNKFILNLKFLFFILFFSKILNQFYKIDLKNKWRIFYYIFNQNNFLFERKKIKSLFSFTKISSWVFSDFFKYSIIKMLFSSILYLFFKNILLRSWEVFLEFFYLFVEIFFIILKFFIVYFCQIFNFLYLKFILRFLLIKIFFFKIFSLVVKFLFIFFTINKFIYTTRGFYLFFFNFFFILFYIFIYVFFYLFFFFFKLFCIFFLFLFSYYFLWFVENVYNFDITSFFPTYLMLFFIINFFFIISLFSFKLNKELLHSEIDFLNADTGIFNMYDFEEIYDIEEEDDDIYNDSDFDRDNYDDENNDEDTDKEREEDNSIWEEFDYNFDFNKYEYLMTTNEGVVSTDIIRPTNYIYDISFLRKYYRRLAKINRIEKNFKKRNKMKLNSFSLLKFLKVLNILLQEQNYIYSSRYLRSFFGHFTQTEELFYIFIAATETDIDNSDRRILKIIKHHIFKLYIAYNQYVFYEETNMLFPEWDFSSINKILLHLTVQYEQDPFEIKLFLSRNQVFDLDEEEFFSKKFWFDQFFFNRVYEIDLSDFNPIFINKCLKKNNNLYLYTDFRLDFVDYDMLNNNSVKYFYYIYNNYSKKSKVFTRLNEIMPYFSRFTKPYYKYLPAFSSENSIDYELGLNIASEGGHLTYYQNTYCGFQLREVFFGENNTNYYIKIMNPYECMDNEYKFRFFKELEFFIDFLKLKNFPNLTRKEFERILVFLNCNEKDWDSLNFDLNFSKKNIIKPYYFTDFPVFLFITFLYFLQENNSFYFWSFNTQTHLEDETDFFPNLVSIEPTIFSTVFVESFLKFIYILAEDVYFYFNFEFLNLNNLFFYEDRMFYIFLFFNYVFEVLFDLLPMINIKTNILFFSDFIILFKIFLVRCLNGFFFYDVSFLFLNIISDILFFLLVFFYKTIIINFLFYFNGFLFFFYILDYHYCFIIFGLFSIVKIYFYFSKSLSK